MDPKQQPVNPPQTTGQSRPSRPNDSGNIQLDAFVKITDPNTKEVIREMRG